MMDGFDGEGGGLTPLAATVEYATADVGVKHLCLDRVGVEIEPGTREGDGIVIVIEEVTAEAEQVHRCGQGERLN
jgi:hypothetical protein